MNRTAFFQRIQFRKNAICLLLMVILMSGCSSIPMESWARLYQLKQQSFSQIDPTQVRVRVSLTEPAALFSDTCRLALRFRYADDSEGQHDFLLRNIFSRQLVRQQFWRGKVVLNQYEFKIDESAIKAFVDFQKTTDSKGAPKQYWWTVYYSLKPTVADQQAMRVDVELKLTEQEDYFFLVKDADIKVEKTH